MGIIIAVFEGESDELGVRGDKVGSGAREATFADIFGEAEASHESEKPAHSVGIGVHVDGKLVIVDDVIEILLDFGGDLIDGVVDVHWVNYIMRM